MSKPQIKKEVGIHFSHKETRIIEFYSTENALSEFQEFGHIHKSNTAINLYDLFVDSRFDFDEVLKYIEEYG